MGAGEYLPPIVVSIIVDDGAGLASLAGFKGAVTDATSSVGLGTGKMGRDVEAAKEAVGSSSDDIAASFEGLGANAVLSQAAIDKALSDETPYERATRAAEDAEKDIEAKSTGFASRVGSTFESFGNTLGSFGMPFGNSVKKFGYAAKEGESAAAGFGSSLRSVANVAGGVGLLIAAGIGIASIKAADDFDVAQSRLQNAVQNTGESFQKAEPSIDGTEKHLVNLGFTGTETANALGTLTVSTGSVTKAESEMALAADLARYKHISLAQASETLAKVNAGSTRALTQLGIQLDVGSMKLTAATKASEALEKAKKNLKIAEEGLAAAEKKGAEEHAAAVAKVESAESALKDAQTTLKSGSESLTGAQEQLKTAQRGVTEAAEKQKQAIKEAAAAVKSAEEAAREAAEQGAKGIETAKNNLSSLEKERAAESNAATIKEIEAKEKSLEATQTTTSAAELAALQGEKAQLEAVDKGMEAQKKEAQLQEAHKGIIEAEATAHKNNKTAIDAVRTAQEKLAKAHKEALANSKENVTAANAVTTAQRGVASAEDQLSKDQQAASQASANLATAQAGLSKSSAGVVAAELKLKEAHEKVSESEKTLQKDHVATGQVLDALKQKIGGAAEAFGTTLPGQTDIAKAKLDEIAVVIGQRLDPALLALLEASKAVASGLAPVWHAFVQGVEWVGRAAANLYIAWEQNWHGIRTVTETVLHVISDAIKIALQLIYFVWVGQWKDLASLVVKVWSDIESTVSKGVNAVVKFVEALPGKVLGVLKGLVSAFKNLGSEMIHGLVSGITSAPGAIVKAVEGLIPGGSAIGKVAGALGLATGGIVTQPTLAVIGEKEPEAVIPLGKISSLGREGVSSLPSTTPSSAPSSGNTAPLIGTVNMISQASPQTLAKELYLLARPLLQGAGT